MNKVKGDAGNIAQTKTLDYFADNQRLFELEYAEKTGELQSFLHSHLEQNQKVVRLYKCFCCEQNRTARKMSNCLIVCRECYRAAQDKGKVGKRNFVEKTLNNFHKFLRRRVSI